MNKLVIFFPLIILTAPLAFAESSNVGIIYWEKEIVSINSFVDIYVNDNDMNKKEYPNFADKFSITVWSDTSPEGLEIQVVENGVYSGIFKGSVYIADFGDPTKNRLISAPGDILYAKYTDYTLPGGSISDIVSAAVVKMSGENMDSILDKIDPNMRHLKTPQIDIPSWVKNNAGWWADGTISESEFISAIEFLIKDGIIELPPTTVSTESSESVPSWVKNNAGWWADSRISDGEFVSGIQHLIKTGLISVSSYTETMQTVSEKPKSNDSKLAALESELEICYKIKVSYKRIDCEKPLKKAITLYDYQTNAQKFEIGPITYYWFGVGSEGNEFEITPTGQAILSIRILAENTSSEITAMHCTSPSICSYDVWDGTEYFKYSGMDFTSGEIVLNPADSREFNILFGPNIGYGGTEFKYDPSKTYYFRINENFGSMNIPLELK